MICALYLEVFPQSNYLYTIFPSLFINVLNSNDPAAILHAVIVFTSKVEVTFVL